MKILVIGSGGREHALAWKLKQSPRGPRIFCAPGNAGTAEVGENIAIATSDFGALVRFAKQNRVDLTVVGPDDPLAAGVVDLFTTEGLRIFGPTKVAAQLESSKIFAKELMREQGIPTAHAGTFERSDDALRFCERTRFPIVIKADGLALGKGVIIAGPFWRSGSPHPHRGIPAWNRMFAARPCRWRELSVASNGARPQAGIGWRCRIQHGRNGSV